MNKLDEATLALLTNDDVLAVNQAIADTTYAVEYAVGDTPFGPFVDGPNTPVLTSDPANDIVSPGHHTIFSRDGHDYILHHRHSVPFNRKFIGRGS